MAKKDNLTGTGDLAEKLQKIKEQLNEPEAKRIKPSAITPKLFVSGRLDRKRHPYSARSLTLLARLEDEIKAYCRGGEIAVLNYLLREGLRKVKAAETVINIDMSDIEKDDI